MKLWRDYVSILCSMVPSYATMIQSMRYVRVRYRYSEATEAIISPEHVAIWGGYTKSLIRSKQHRSRSLGHISTSHTMPTKPLRRLRL